MNAFSIQPEIQTKIVMRHARRTIRRCWKCRSTAI